MSHTYRPTLSPPARFLAQAWPIVIGISASVKGESVSTLILDEVFAGIPITVFLWRLGRVRLVVDQNDVTSFGFLATRRLPWAEIDHFALSEGSSFAHAVLKDGSLVGLPAIQAAQINWLLGRRSRAADIVAELNRLNPSQH